MADEISLKCEECGRELKAPADRAGGEIRCECGNAVRVPPGADAGKPEPKETLSPEEVARKWYYAVGEERFGPVSLGMLKRLVGEGRVGLDDLAWTRGMPGWERVANVRQLQLEMATSRADGEGEEEQGEQESAQPPAPAGEAKTPRSGRAADESGEGGPEPPALPGEAAAKEGRIMGRKRYGMVGVLAGLTTVVGIAGLVAAPLLFVVGLPEKASFRVLIAAAVSLLVGVMSLGVAQLCALARRMAASVQRLEQKLGESE